MLAEKFGFISCASDMAFNFVKLNSEGNVKLIINKLDLTWRLLYKDKCVPTTSETFSTCAGSLDAGKVTWLFETLSLATVCEGHVRFSAIVSDCMEKKCVELTSTDKYTVIGYIQDNTIRHVDCSIVIRAVKKRKSTTKDMCTCCADSKFQDRLRVRESNLRRKSEQPKSTLQTAIASSKCSFVNLSKDEAPGRLHALSKRIRPKTRRSEHWKVSCRISNTWTVKQYLSLKNRKICLQLRWMVKCPNQSFGAGGLLTPPNISSGNSKRSIQHWKGLKGCGGTRSWSDGVFHCLWRALMCTGTSIHLAS